MSDTPAPGPSRLVIVGLAFIAVLAIVGAALGISAAVRHSRDQAFLAEIRADQSATFGRLSDDELLDSRRLNCEQWRNGATLDERLYGARRNHDALNAATGADISLAQHLANVEALWSASINHC